jgi:hypothetical protein
MTLELCAPQLMRFGPMPLARHRISWKVHFFALFSVPLYLVLCQQTGTFRVTWVGKVTLSLSPLYVTVLFDATVITGDHHHYHCGAVAVQGIHTVVFVIMVVLITCACGGTPYYSQDHHFTHRGLCCVYGDERWVLASSVMLYPHS